MTQILTADELRVGRIVAYEGEIYEVKKYDFPNQLSGGTSVKLVFNNIYTNTLRSLSVAPALKFQTADVQEEEVDYMYDDGDTIFTSDGAEFPISKVRTGLLELIPQAGKFRVISINDEIYTIVLPKKARLKIKSTEPALRSQTAKTTYKPATLSNGWTIQVPAFIEADNEVIVDTTDLDHLKYDSIPT